MAISSNEFFLKNAQWKFLPKVFEKGFKKIRMEISFQGF